MGCGGSGVNFRQVYKAAMLLLPAPRLDASWILTVLACLVVGTTAEAQTMPLLDTDDSSLGTTAVTEGQIHPLVQLGVGNGDFSRGAYDGDAADLDRLPFQTLVAVGAELAHGSDGTPTLWLEAVSTNNFHASHADETASPRAWYDNNNLVGLIAQVTPGLRGALTYVIKTAPNGFASTVHEANASVVYSGRGFLGVIKPAAVVTMHPHGGHGVYSQIGITPSGHLTSGSGGPSLSFPIKAGVRLVGLLWRKHGGRRLWHGRARLYAPREHPRCEGSVSRIGVGTDPKRPGRPYR